MCRACLSEGHQIEFNTKDELEVSITAEFTNLNKEKVGKVC